MGELPLNQILCGDCAEILQGFPENSIDLAVTSPPYWGLRNYGEETVKVWGGDSTCNHDFSKPAPPPRQRSKKDIVNQNSKQSYKDNPSAYDSTESSFCSKCGAWLGSLGLEPHPQLFIDHLVEICREIKRVLKPSGTFWLNLGDSYCSGHGNINENFNKRIGNASGIRKQEHKRPSITPPKSSWLQPKQKLMIPSRVAIALQHDGWILRNDIIWYKPNHMPSSVRDRLTNAYEHIFLFAKARRYYFDLDAIRVPHSASTLQRITQPNVMNQPGGDKQRELRGEGGGNASRSADMVKSLARNYEEWYFEQREKKSWHDHEHDETMGFGQQKRGFKVKNIPHPRGKNPGDIWEIEAEKLTKHDIAVGRIGNFSYTDPLHTKEYHPKGKNPGDLWRIPTQPFPGAHFAVFPRALVEPIVKAGCPRWICSRCGKPRTRITMREGQPPEIGKSNRGEAIDFTGSGTHRKTGQVYQNWLNKHPKITLGWSDCGCGEGWVGGVVLDPFAGSGTALRVARKLGRRFIGIEINQEYAEMCERRLRADTYKPPPEGVQPLTEIFENE